MIGAIDSYLQIISALYLSISLDNHFCRHIWHPEFSEKTGNFLKENTFWKTNKLITRIKENTDAQFNSLASRARQRGGFMFSVCIILIIYEIFEEYLTKGMPAEPFAHLAFLSAVLIVIGLQLYINFNFIWSTVCLLLCLSAYAFTHHYLRAAVWEPSLTLWKTVATLCIISFPLLYQFVWHRLTNSFYMRFWENALSEERIHYENAKNFGKNGITAEDLPNEYSNYFANCYGQINSTEDLRLKDINECLFNRLLPRCAPPGLLHLIFFRLKLGLTGCLNWIKQKFCNHKSPPKATPDLKGLEMPIQAVGATNLAHTDYERYYQLYNTSIPLPKLKHFCENHKLNYEDFHAYFKRRRADSSEK